MISSKILRGLQANKTYLVYDDLYVYNLHKYTDFYKLSKYDANKLYESPNMCIFEKTLKDLTLNASINVDKKLCEFYKHQYIDRGYTNRYKALSSVGFKTLHGEFSFYDLNFFGEIKDENTIEEFYKFRNTLKSYRNLR